MSNIFDNITKLHFIGIGGSGMCPMAEILLSKGYEITGSDANESDTLERIKSQGINVFLGHDKANIGDAQLVIYTAAAKMDNPEIVAAKEKGVTVVERSVALGHLTSKFDKTIAVSGTHGKTSTTAMITQILIEADFDPNAIIGGKLPKINGNSRVGESEYIVCEACEYVDTFLQLHPAISLILNLEPDHLDYFINFENMINSFNKFSHQTSELIAVNGDDENALKAVSGITKAKVLTFGLNEKNDYYVTNIVVGAMDCYSFTLESRDEKICDISLKVPGEHNIKNALAAATVCHYLGAPIEAIVKALSEFTGVHRRFEILGNFNGVTVVDDFAHHPTELKTTLEATSRMGFNNVWAIFQPHTYSRTHEFLNEFARVLAIPDHVVFTEILAVREVNKSGIHITDLEKKVAGSCHFSSFQEITEHVMKNAKPGDLIITLGGGDIYKCANLLVDKYNKLIY